MSTFVEGGLVFVVPVQAGGCVALVRLCFCGVGLSLFCWWSISVAPVRGGTYFSLLLQREVGKRKQLTPPILKRVPRTVAVVVHLESVPSRI
ncbi:hypothetical protein R70006_02924 [Paraburkholderia domus]|uniref:Uncharacterized protein n=1 Tax=Paraburkholderia domus TaxID=2793075 RepID=A0A9N8N2F7_9BURK|nr:hypothetical protein R70006_02924 [Paraburkholderia domus]CAE6910639.1 hypothetical protein R70211_03887 [Paraburkholderia domus]